MKTFTFSLCRTLATFIFGRTYFAHADLADVLSPLIASSALAQGLLPPPANFTATWIWPNSTPPAKVQLTWEQPPGTDSSTVYMIHRRYGSSDAVSGWTSIHNGVVPNVSGSTTLRSIVDTGLTQVRQLEKTILGGKRV